MVYLVGGGPGNPGLLTLRGAEVLARCDAVVHDRLVGTELLDLARPDAEFHDVGKSAGRHSMPQEDISALLVNLARRGLSVCRLKGGDPFVFGRGGEEGSVLASAGIPFEVVPGVSSSVAAPAFAGIPVTDRRCARSFAVIAGHTSETASLDDIRWESLAHGVDTLVFLMGLKQIGDICARLIAAGRAPAQPAAAIERGTTPAQRVVQATLETLPAAAEQLESPVAIVVGDVVSLREELAWFERRPLHGLRVLVTRSREQAGALSRLLREQGAQVEEIPLLHFEPLPLPTTALSSLLLADWIVFSSVNGVRFLMRALKEHDRDVRALGMARVAAIGSETARCLESLGLQVSVVPPDYRGESLAEAIPAAREQRIVMVGAKVSREAAVDILNGRGASVERLCVYETHPVAESARRLAADDAFDVITFASSSTVRHFVELGGAEIARRAKVACIGPVTAATARELGLAVAIESAESTIPGLAGAIAAHFRRNA